MENRKTIEQEMLELNEQFGAFLKTKGISAKFKLAFANMAESADGQRAADRANFEAIKAQSIEENKDFVTFLHTKGVKAKINLVIENIKKGAQNAPANTAAQIANAKAVSAESLSQELDAFLKARGLDGKYSIVLTEE